MGLPPGAMMPGGLHQRMGSGGGLPPMGLPPGMHGMPPGGPPPLLERVGSGAHPPGPGAQSRATRHCITSTAGHLPANAVAGVDDRHQLAAAD